MYDTGLNTPIKVKTHEEAGSSIHLSKPHLAQVRQVLEENKIRHWLDHVGIKWGDGPWNVWLYLWYKKDAERAQRLLDEVEEEPRTATGGSGRCDTINMNERHSSRREGKS